MDNLKEAKTANKFLSFCYNYPMDIKDRFLKYYGENLGNHFYKSFQYNVSRVPNTFYGMIDTFSGMTTDHQETFMKMVNDYYEEQN